MTFYDILKVNGACPEGLNWVEANKIENAQQFWDKCPHPGWMAWIIQPGDFKNTLNAMRWNYERKIHWRRTKSIYASDLSELTVRAKRLADLIRKEYPVPEDVIQ